MTELLLKASIGLAVFMFIVFGIKIVRGLGVRKVKISYKLVVEKDGNVEEIPFENFEQMLEKVKELETPAAEPEVPAADGESPAGEGEGEKCPTCGQPKPQA